MKITELTKKLEIIYDKKLCYDFDNAGFNILTKDDDIKSIVLTVDIIDKTIDFAIKNNCNLIISHHPLVFHSFKNIVENSQDNKIKKLISYDISAYSIHTNFDVQKDHGMGKLVLDQFNIQNNISKTEYIENIDINNNEHGLGKIITLKDSMNLNDILKILVDNFKIDTSKISYYTNKSMDDRFIKKIAILPGSGRDYVKSVIDKQCDLYISSDLSHHDILDLYENNVCYINATHYGLEKLFCYYMKELLENIVDEKDNIQIYQFKNEDF